MTTFGSYLTGAVFPHLMSTFGETITYTPSGGDAVSISAAIDRGEAASADGAERRENEDGYGVKRTARVVIYADADNGVAAPAEGDTVTFDSQTWGVDAVVIAHGQAELSVVLYARSEMSARRKRLWR